MIDVVDRPVCIRRSTACFMGIWNLIRYKKTHEIAKKAEFHAMLCSYTRWARWRAASGAADAPDTLAKAGA